MAPTPNVNTHRFSISYIVDGLTHKVQHHCHAVDVAGTMHLVAHDDTEMDFDTYLALWNTKFGPCLPASTTGAGAILYERVEQAYVPVASGTWSPTVSVHAAIKAEAIQATYKDITNVRSNMVFTEMWWPIPYLTRAYSGITDSDWAEFIINQLGSTDFNDIGGYVRSLAGNPLGTFKSFVVDTNEKLRRVRGLK